MQFHDRHDFAVFILTLSGKNAGSRMEDAVRQLFSLYPVPVTKRQILLRKNRKTKNWIAAVYRDKSGIPAGVLSTWYILDSLTSFTGTVFFREQRFTEICRMKNGALIESICTDAGTGEYEAAAHSAGAVFLSKEFYTTYHKNKNNTYLFELPSIIRAHSVKQIAEYTVLGIIIAVALVCAAYNYHKIQTGKKERQTAQEALKLQEEAERKGKEKEMLCSTLYKKYHDLYTETSVEPYAFCSLIYQCLDKTTTVDSLSITGNTFQVDLRGADAVSVLKKFEQQHGLTECTINRIAIEQETGKQVYTVSGTAVQVLPDAEKKDADGRTAFYEKKISGLEMQRNDCAKMTLSEAVWNIRKQMNSCGCSEEYMQRQTNNGCIELDVSMRGTSTAILSFLEQCSGNIIIKNVRIKNYPDQNTVSALVRIVTYIPENRQTDNETVSAETQTVTPAVISSVFSRTYSGIKKMTAVPEGKKKSPPVAKPKRVSWMTYLGTGRTSDGTVFIFIKNKKTGVIIKINKFTDSGKTVSFTAADGKNYEVAK
jgi:hypothetical protein